MIRRAAPPPLGLVLVRVAAGVVLFGAGRGFIGAVAPDGPAIAALVESTSATASGPVAWWGRVVLLENPDALAFLWPWLLTLTGAALFLGLLVRPAGYLASFAMLHGMVYGRAETTLLHALLAVMALGCAVALAGRRLGLDALVGESLPSGLTWTRAERR